MKELIRFIKFNIVGVANTLVDMGSFSVFVRLMGLPWALAQVMSYSLGVLNSYFMNRKFTFGMDHGFGAKEFSKFIVVNLISLGCSLLIMKILIENFAMVDMMAKFVSIGITMIINYTGNRLWTFEV